MVDVHQTRRARGHPQFEVRVGIRGRGDTTDSIPRSWGSTCITEIEREIIARSLLRSRLWEDSTVVSGHSGRFDNAVDGRPLTTSTGTSAES